MKHIYHTIILLFIGHLVLAQSTSDHIQDKAAKTLDRGLITRLDSIRQLDQQIRSQIFDAGEKQGLNSRKRNDLFAKMVKQDSSNLIEIKQIIKQYGWPGTDMVGAEGNKTVWLVIHHADLETRLQYLPKLKKSVKQGKTKAAYLALTLDRNAMEQGKKQIYGSQYVRSQGDAQYQLYPIKDEVHVNERRKAVGLGPIEEEAKTYGIDYKLPVEQE